MAVTDSTKTSYSAGITGIKKRTISDMLDLIDPIDTPLVAFLGLSGANGMNLVNQPGEKVEWIQDRYRTMQGTVSATLTTGATAITVSDASYFTVGDVILMPDSTEKAWVSAVDTSGNLLTVTRGFGATSAATQATGTAKIIGSARLEGADTDFGPMEDPATAYNYTQIFQKAIKVSENAVDTAVYGGITDEFRRQVDKAIPELTRALDLQLFYGERLVGSASTPRGMGNFDTFITTNTASVAKTDLAYSDFHAMMTSAHMEGGMPNALVLSPRNVKYITDLYNNSNYLRIERTEDTIGMVVQKIDTDWGTLTLLPDRWCPESRMYFLQSEYAGIYERRPFAEYDVPRGGDWVAGEVIGEYSLVVKNEAAHGYLALT